MKLSFIPHTLYFKRPFSIAHGSRDSTPVVFTRLEHDGLAGYGEASMPPYVGEDHDTVLKFLAKAQEQVSRFSDPLDIAAILEAVDRTEAGNHAAKASLDIALHDLAGKIRKQPCHEWFGADQKKLLPTAYTIAMDNPEGIHGRIVDASGYTILKVKLGSNDDKKIIEEIRKNSDKAIMVDANEGWMDKHAALEMVRWLAEKNVLLVEQPMPKGMMAETAWLAQRSPLPILADEAVKRLSDLEKVKGIYHGVNIKLMKCTGLNEAGKMIAFARKAGMKILIGCMSETTCGVSAAAQLAPFADWIDLDGPLLLKEDYFDGIRFSAGKIILNDLPGIGVLPRPSLRF